MCAPTKMNVITADMTRTSHMQKAGDLKTQLILPRGPLRRRNRSSLSERRSRELLSDSSDRLSELIRKNQSCLVDFESDDESDLEEDY
ncbi:unnamed protein product [Cylindrotheca closterium]|uniref:Uncharacterized protein n=1 Tax=Cylindrotheca closterium TaxID=2856 RepID=A0AAD2JKS2_9STRA|nr:unnamed protein product [Cylindrotheca closterium]CAJ1959196.1 unnamed protein product [Cylindrotheca closterium]